MPGATRSYRTVMVNDSPVAVMTPLERLDAALDPLRQHQARRTGPVLQILRSGCPIEVIADASGLTTDQIRMVERAAAIDRARSNSSGAHGQHHPGLARVPDVSSDADSDPSRAT